MAEQVIEKTLGHSGNESDHQVCNTLPQSGNVCPATLTFSILSVGGITDNDVDTHQTKQIAVLKRMPTAE